MTAAGAAVLLLLSSALLAQQPTPPSPNFLFILADDLGYRDVGFLGDDRGVTPHIDRLAADGMVFTDAYANGPNCAPTRACLMSGQYGPRHGVYTVNNSARGVASARQLVPIENRRVLPESTVTLAEALRQAGYRSALVGKWHLGDDPRSQGFDVNVGGSQAGHPKSYTSPYRMKALADGADGEYLTERLTDEALAFVEENREQPFFLMLSHYTVHTPIQPPADVAEELRAGGMEARPARYAAMIKSLDRSVGRVLNKLTELDLDRRTVVIFFSDNGGHGGWTSMTPLRGAKGTLYEGGIRVPLAVRWHGVIEPGSRCATPVIGVDFYPTLLQLAGAQPPAGVALDGESLLPLLEGRGVLSRDALFWHFPAYLQATDKRSGPWRTTPVGVVRAGDWKLLEFFENGELELYDLRQDVGEQRDLSDSQPELAAEMLARLRRWRELVDAPVPTERNPEFGR